MAVPNLPVVVPIFAHHDCLCNQLTAISNRVCGVVPQPRPDAIRRLMTYARLLGKSLGFYGESTTEEFLSHYSGPKYRRYQEAAEDVAFLGLSRKDAQVKMFIKCEKIYYTSDKPNPDPRAIQFRDPKYAVAFGKYLKPLERRIYALRGNRLNKLPPTRIIGKGLNQRDRALLLVEKMDRFRNPLVLSLDMSRFDQHVSHELLQCEHAVYRAMNSDPEFSRLLDWQLRNTVVTTKGIKYVTRGKRMSGDMNTAVGNCLISVMMIAELMGRLGCPWDALDDGDDLLLIIEQDMRETVYPLLEPHFLDLGMELKVEGEATCVEQVEWCQGHPVNVDGRWVFIRNPKKVLSGALVSNKWIQMKSESSKRALANTIGLCELILNHGVPVLQAFALAIMRNANTDKQILLLKSEQLGYRVYKEIGKSRAGKIPKYQPLPIADSTRLSFAKAFGISIDQQMWYENYLDQWSFGFDDLLELPTPIAVNSWLWESEMLEVDGVA